tara:strand:+ start:934 stop:1080 length:147 start_codon:yes stop_codon:yes gene_type:complete
MPTDQTPSRASNRRSSVWEEEDEEGEEGEEGEDKVVPFSNASSMVASS